MNEKTVADADRTFSACAVARYILDRYAESYYDDSETSEDIRDMGITKLIKLTYIAHGFALGLLHKPLIGDKIEAWNYGPAIRALYARIKTEQEQEKKWVEMLQDDMDEAKEIIGTNAAVLIDKVIAIYGYMTAGLLTNITHKEGTPWHITATNGDLYIENSLIESYYEEKLNGKKQ